MISSRITGEMSRPPRLGSTRRIGRKTRFRHRVQRVPDRAHEILTDVQDVEGDQPGHHRDGDDDPLEQIERKKNDVENGAHETPAR